MEIYDFRKKLRLKDGVREKETRSTPSKSGWTKRRYEYR